MKIDIYNTDRKYNIIYADPPWQYKDKALSGKRGVDFKYNTMSLEDIKKLPINDIADKDCLLFLWVTMPQLECAFDLIKSWGFTYKTCAFNWIKKNKKSTNTNFWGMGNWTRSNSEICLLAIKGKPKRMSAKVHQVIESPIQQHSKKPDIVRDKIVELCGDLQRIELFARNTTENWDVWGNEV